MQVACQFVAQQIPSSRNTLLSCGHSVKRKRGHYRLFGPQKSQLSAMQHLSPSKKNLQNIRWLNCGKLSWSNVLKYSFHFGGNCDILRTLRAAEQVFKKSTILPIEFSAFWNTKLSCDHFHLQTKEHPGSCFGFFFFPREQDLKQKTVRVSSLSYSISNQVGKHNAPTPILRHTTTYDRPGGHKKHFVL